MKSLSLVLLSGLALAACGGDDGGSGGSGISSSKLVKDLTPAESIQLCHSLAAEWPQRDVTCSGQTAQFGLDDADCTSGSGDPIGDIPDTCTATVGDAEACFKALGMVTDEQICNRTVSLPASCEVVQSDACGGGDDDGSAAAPRTIEEMRDRALRLMRVRS